MLKARPTPTRQGTARTSTAKTSKVRASASVEPVRKIKAAPKTTPSKAGAAKRSIVKPRLLADGDGVVRILGIDPGNHTGLACFHDGVLTSLSECAPEDLSDYLRQAAPLLSLVVFEDSRLAQAVWTGEGTLAKRLKMGRNVGEIDAWCRLIEATCKKWGIPCFGMPPSAKAGNAVGKKLNAEQFKAFTGWASPSNQHNRDASLIAWPYRRAKP